MDACHSWCAIARPRCSVSILHPSYSIPAPPNRISSNRHNHKSSLLPPLKIKSVFPPKSSVGSMCLLIPARRKRGELSIREKGGRGPDQKVVAPVMGSCLYPTTGVVPPLVAKRRVGAGLPIAMNIGIQLAVEEQKENNDNLQPPRHLLLQLSQKRTCSY